MAVLVLVLTQQALAGEAQPETGIAQEASPEGWFAHGRSEAAFTSGAFFSPFVATHKRPTLDYTITGLQFGYMLGDARGAGWWRGNFELAADTFGSAIFKGPGTYIAGETVWVKYNFLPQKPRGLVPYFQAGAGIVLTDIDRGIVGERFNFNLDLGIGARYFISRRCSLDLEYRYQHISNANLGRHNPRTCLWDENADGALRKKIRLSLEVTRD